MIAKFNSSADETKGECQMYQVISKNRANNETAIVKTDKALTQDQAEKLAIRCTMAESNPRVIYNVEAI